MNLLLALPLALGLGGQTAAETPGAEPHEARRLVGVMGTELEIKAIGGDAAAMEKAVDAAVEEMRRVEDLMTDWRPSPLTELNEAAGEGPVEVPEELARLIARAVEIGKVTEGAFDVTYAAVGELWDFKSDPPVVPSAERIAAALERVDSSRVRVNLKNRTVDLPAGMRIGLGGIAKGYGVDRAMAVLREHGVENGIVNAGGDLKALGRKRDGKLWEIAVKHPRNRELVLAAVPLSNKCVMTSGDYERFFEHEGTRYHHILDPRTGYPSTGCMSATVFGPDAALTDSLATAMCVLGPERGLAVVDGLKGIDAILVGMDGEVRVSRGLQVSDD